MALTITRFLVAVVLVAATIAPVSLAGDRLQQIAQPQGGPLTVPQGGAPGGRAGGPPREGRPTTAQTGTAVIRGRILAADTKQPLRRARIQLSGAELGREGRTTSTSPDGRYEIKDLPAGRYTLTVNRSGYLSLRHGQRRPFEQGKPLQVEESQVFADVDFSLPRMSVISGRLLDEAGEPISGVGMYAMRRLYFQGQTRLVPVSGGGVVTDDTGQYRLLGLNPGSYVVLAHTRETWTVVESAVERVMGYTPTYYPGTPDIALARRVAVTVGQEASGIDFNLNPGRSASVSGIATDSRGRPLAARSVSVAQEFVGPNGGSFMTAGMTTTGADGSFRVRNLPPGDYKLQTTATVEAGDGTVEERAALPLTLAGVDLDGLSLMTTAGWSIAGRVTTENGVPPKIARDRITVAGLAAGADLGFSSRPQARPGSGSVKEDWTFAVSGLIGAVRVRVTLPEGWGIKSILQDGNDVTDTIFELKSGEVLNGVDVVITDRVTSVAGQLTDAAGKPTIDGTVLVFSADANRWAHDSRYVRAARPDQQGRYQIRGLPPGEYLAVAMDYVEDGTWNDPEYLESIRQHGQLLTLSEAGSRDLPLKLVAP